MSALASLAGYQLVSSLGTGGMARVHLAVKRQPGGFTKLFVLKVLRAELGDDDYVAMFREEANLAARLNHPNVVQTYEVGEDGGAHFLAMEYLEGQPLSAVLSKLGRDVPLAAHVRILHDVLAGLHYAHELTDFGGEPLGIVHRDVSPQNVFVTYAGPSKVIDFGIAKVAGPSRTRDGIVKGKLGYMAPEQAGGLGVDRRADIFAAGILLWEAIARRRFAPSGDDQISAILRRVAGKEPRIREVVPDADPELARICDRALSLAPDDRWATADDMRRALEAWLRARDGGEVRDVALLLERFSEERSAMRRLVEDRVRGLDERASSNALTESETRPERPERPDGTGSGRRTVPELVGKVLGRRYRLERALGVGGMGLVFEATQLDLQRRVAVKVLSEVHPKRIERLRREALLAGNIRSPHVVSVFDFVAPPDETPFLVMEMLEGESLASLLERSRVIPVSRAARIASQILLGLEAAHEAGFVHRDIKPSNVWLQAGGGGRDHVKLLDFGIAKSLRDEDATALTATGAVAGTPEYVAPEQLKGLPFDARVDLHAVGVVLYLMLAGELPWRSSEDALLVEILERVPTSLHERREEVPAPLASIVARALEKDPRARFATASDMRRELLPFAAAEPEPFVRPSAAMRAAAKVPSDDIDTAYAAAGETIDVPNRTRAPLALATPEHTPEAPPRPEPRTKDGFAAQVGEGSAGGRSRLALVGVVVASAAVVLGLRLRATPRHESDVSERPAKAPGSVHVPAFAASSPEAPPVAVDLSADAAPVASASGRAPRPSPPVTVRPAASAPVANPVKVRPGRRPIDDTDPYR